MIKRDLAIKAIKDLPIEYLEQIFQFNKFDPDSDENKKILELNLLSDEYLIKKINYLKSKDCIELIATIDFDNLKTEKSSDT